MVRWWSLFLLVAMTTADLDTEEKVEEKKSNGTIIGIDLGTTYSWSVAMELSASILKTKRLLRVWLKRIFQHPRFILVCFSCHC
jgi:hypothetical protein